MNKKKTLLYTLLSISLLIAIFWGIKTYRHGFFKQTPTGLAYRVVHQGKGPKPQEGEVMILNISYKTPQGKVLFSTEEQGIPMGLPYVKDKLVEDGGITEAFGMLQKGDKLICKLDGSKIFDKSWPYIAKQHDVKEDSKLFFHVHLQDIMTEENYQKWEKEQIAMLQQKQQEEASKQLQEDINIIKKHLAEQQITAQSTPSGLHYVIDTPGQGGHPQQGNTVKVNYTGQLLNGKVFDTSVEGIAKEHSMHNPQRPYEPIAFSLGAKQVIAGWDEGIGLLKKGGKGRLFIPSTLAYGPQSVGGGLIPANAILVFEVELVDFNK